jgi:hypothetical protein
MSEVATDVSDYEMAIPLEDAAWHFAGRKLWNKYQDAQTASNRLMAKGCERAKEVVPDADIVTQIIAAACVGLGAWSDGRAQIDDVLSEMDDRLCTAVGTGKLIPIGYEMPRKADDRPVRLPNDVFQRRYLNAAKSEVQGAGLWFVSVRIAVANDDHTQPHKLTVLPNVPEAAALTADASTKLAKGRLNEFREPILCVYRTLIATGRIDFARSCRATCKDIQNILQQKLPKGPNLETIRGYIVADFAKRRAPQ